jgi:hypothetical protein
MLGYFRLKHERFNIEFSDVLEVPDVGGDQGEIEFDGGCCDECIGEAQAVGECELVDEIGGALRDGWGDLKSLGVALSQGLF